MLVIREKQMQELSEQKSNSFVNRAMKHLQSDFPAKIKGMDESSQHNMIREVINRANKYQIKTEDNIIRYLEFEMAYGSDFDKVQKAREILCSEDIDETEKIDLLDANKSELYGMVRKKKKTDNAIYENNSESMAPEAATENDVTNTTSLKKKQCDCWGIKKVKEVGSIAQGCSSDESKKLSYVVKVKVIKTGVGEGLISGVKFDLKGPSDEKNKLYCFYVNHPDNNSDSELSYNTDAEKGEYKKDDSMPGKYSIKIQRIIDVKLKQGEDGKDERDENGRRKFELSTPEKYTITDERYKILSYDSIQVFHNRDKQDNKKVITTVLLRFIELKCFVDSHMHIMSGHCSTAPMIDKIADDKSPLRKKQGGLGLSGALVADIGIGKKCTADIAKQALEDNQKTYENFKRDFPLNYENCELFTPMVVLPVDFEYAHIKGYEGKTIYRQKKDGTTEPKKCEDIYYDKTSCKTNFPSNKIKGQIPVLQEVYTCYQNYYGEDSKAKVFFCDFKGELRELKKKAKQLKGEFTELEKKAKQLKGESTKLEKHQTDKSLRGFEPWQRQLEQTVKVVIESPWKLIPFFFYEPRRWLKDKIWLDKKYTLWDNLPIEEVATEKQSGLFVGFKMYTPYGFKPSDPKLPVIDDFYKYCADNQIPIMTHCTSGGTYTHERELYLQREDDKTVAKEYTDEIELKEKELEKLKQEKQKINKVFIEEDDKERIEQIKLEITMSEEEIQNVKIKYFNDKFVSPSAWKEVLNNHKNLKLCLAHFGGKKAWAYIISDLCSIYPNVYTDVSDMLHAREYRNIIEDVLLSKAQNAQNAKRILYKVMFGTDWYVMKTNTLGPDFQFDYYRYCLRSKRFLDELTIKLKKILDEDEDLWTLFTVINPFRYLGFVDNNAEVNTTLIDNIHAALLKKGSEKDELCKNTEIIKKTAGGVAQYLKSDGERLKLVKWGYEDIDSPIDSPIEFPKEYEEKINPKIKIDYSA